MRAQKWAQGTAPLPDAIQEFQETTCIDFVGHDLCRAAAIMMTGMGIPQLTGAKILNHVEPGVTAVTDRTPAIKTKREALDAWSRRLQTVVSNSLAPSDPKPDSK